MNRLSAMRHHARPQTEARRLLLCVVAATLGIAGPATAVQLDDGTLCWRLDQTSGALHDIRASVNQATLECASARISLRSRDGQTLPPTAVTVSTRAPQTSVTASYAFGDLRTELHPGDTALSIRFRATNRSPDTHMLTLAFGVTVHAQGTRLYTGKETLGDLSEVTRPQRWSGVLAAMARLPILAVYAQEAGLALGAGAEDFHSQFVPEVTPAQDGALEVSLTIPITLFGNGGSYAGWLHLFAFSPKYAERDAIARYQALYPRRFLRRTGVDPRLHGIAASYGSWQQADAELMRLTGADWEWCIRPSRRTGDLADAHYDYTPTRPFSTVKCKKFLQNGKWVSIPNNSTREQWLSTQRQMLEHGRWCNVANAFYTLAHAWVEEQLALQFPDSLTSEFSPGDTWLSLWGAPQDTVRSVFTYRTSWGTKVREMMREVVGRNTPIAAFAFDSVSGHQLYRGRALREIENVSWDDDGPYVARGVANARLYEFVHTLTHDGYTVGVVNNSNMLQHVLDAFYADATLIESNPWRLPPPWPLQNRYAFGEKSVSWWEGYHLDELLHLDGTSMDDRIDALRGLAHNVAHNSFRCGITYQHYFSNGVEYLLRLLPAMQACNRAGWRAVSGVTAEDSRLSLARYGQGLNAFVSVGCLSREPVSEALTLFPAELWGRFVPLSEPEPPQPPLLFADVFGHPTANTVAGTTVSIAARLPGRLLRVFRSVGALNPGAAGTASMQQRVGYDRVLVEGTFRGNAEWLLLPTTRAHRRLATVTVNGTPITLEPDETRGATATVRLDAHGQRAELTAVYQSLRTDLSQAQILCFPFTDDDSEPTFQIHCADDADTKALARRFIEFFRHAKAYRQKLSASACRVHVTIETGPDLPALTLLLLGPQSRLPRSSAEVSRTGPFVTGDPEHGVLMLCGSTRQGLETIVHDVMNVLGRTLFRDVIGAVRTPGMSGQRLYLLPEEKALFEPESL